MSETPTGKSAERGNSKNLETFNRLMKSLNDVKYESNNGETLENFVDHLITHLYNNKFFSSPLLDNKFIKTSLKKRLLRNLEIIIDDELVSQSLVAQLLTDELNNHKALLDLLITSTPENLELFLKQKSFRQIIITILRENNHNLILKLPKIYKNLDLLIDYEVFSQIELDSLLDFNDPNQEILKIIANSDPENLNFFAQRISPRFLRELIYNWNFQDLLKLALLKNLELLDELIINLLTRLVSDEKGQKPSEEAFIVAILLAIKADYYILEILKELGFLTEEKLKEYSNRNNFIFFITNANPLNLQLLQEKELLTEDVWEFLETHSKDLMIYSNPGVLKLLLDHQILNAQNLQDFNDITIKSALLQYGKPENFEVLIKMGLINANNFNELAKLPAFYHLVKIPTENLEHFLESRPLTPEELINLLKNSPLGFDDPPEMIIEYTDPDIYSKILSRLPKPPSNQN